MTQIETNTTERPLCYTTNEAAAVAKCHPNTLRAEINRGNLRAARVGNRFRILHDALRDWLKGLER
jgi:excisionase family DNA binding protein